MDRDMVKDQLETAQDLIDSYKGGGKLTDHKIGDMLADLMIYCKINNIDFKNELDYGYRHSKWELE